MKPLIIGLGIGVIVMGVIATVVIPSVTEVKQNTVEVEVTPEWAEDTDAVEAAKSVIQRKEWEIELEGVESDIEALRVRKEQLEKDLGTY